MPVIQDVITATRGQTNADAITSMQMVAADELVRILRVDNALTHEEARGVLQLAEVRLEYHALR